MMNYFLFDASSLVKRYFPEKGSPFVDRLFQAVAPARLSCLMLGAAETAAALVRKRNGGLMNNAQLAVAIDRLRMEVIDAVDVQKWPCDNQLIESSMALLLKYPINSTDAALLRIAINVGATLRASGDDLVLVASDTRLIIAARSEGVVAFNPETQSRQDLDALT
jgi:predicted nucleic acid-binding protein